MQEDKVPRQKELLLQRPSRKKAQHVLKIEYFCMNGTHSVREGEEMREMKETNRSLFLKSFKGM